MFGVDLTVLIPTILGVLKETGATEGISAKVKAELSSGYARLKALMLEKLQEDGVDLESPLTSLEEAPDDDLYREMLDESLKNAPDVDDDDLRNVVHDLVELLKQTSAGANMSIEQNVSGDKNIVVGSGGLQAGNINMG